MNRPARSKNPTRVSHWLAGLLFVLAQAAYGQSSKPLDREAFARELDSIASICDRVQLPEQARLTRAWLPAEREDQYQLFLPRVESPAPSGVLKQWHDRFLATRRAHALHVLEQAKAVVAEDERAAYQLVWRALREDPKQPEALRVLGTLARTPTALPRTSRKSVDVPELGWPAGSYVRVESPHFVILSHSDVKTTRQIALQLEQFYVLWSQFFFELWAPPNVVQKRLAGEDVAWPQHPRMKVALVRDRAEYIAVLGVGEQNIGRSVGYYNPGARMSIFYPDAELEDTLQHELTHQLLMEATHIAPKKDAGNTGGIWLLEGIALYMESLRQRTTHWTLGGWDAERIQTSRYRGLRDGMWPDWETFATANSESWKADPGIARLYSHAVGLTHVLLDRMEPEAREDTFKHLVGIYQGQNNSQELLQRFGGNEEEAKEGYQDKLLIRDADVEQIAASNQIAELEDLVLAGSELSEKTWKLLERAQALKWLDVSFTNATDENLAWLRGQQLKRLSVEGTNITQLTVDKAATIETLVELDLSSCRKLDDDSLHSLRAHPSLEILWLTNTVITAESLELLDTLDSLIQTDIRQTRIRPEEWEAFLMSHPKLQGE